MPRRMSKHDLEEPVLAAIREAGGTASLVDVARWIWLHHEADLRASGDLFYTWQYDMRWAAQRLRDSGALRASTLTPRGSWQLA